MEEKKIKRPDTKILGWGLAYQAGEALKTYRQRLNEESGVTEPIPDKEVQPLEKTKKKDK